MRMAVVLALALLGALAGPGAVKAADWAIVPSVTARTEFNSNLNYNFVAPVSDYIFTLSPTASFNYTTDIGQLQGKLGLTGLHYLSHGNLDHIDQNFQINGQYQVTPRWSLSLRSAYISDTSLTEEFLASGLIMTRTPRQSIQANPGMTYALTERLSSTVNYNFIKVNYQSPQFQNYLTHQVGWRLQQQLKNERTILMGNVLATESRYPAQDNLFKNLGFQLGGVHKFSPDWEVNLLGGISISWMDFHTQTLDVSQFPYLITVKQVKVRQTKASPFVNLSLSRRWKSFYITGGYSREQSASGYGTVSDNNHVYFSMNYAFSERLSFGLTGDYALTSQISNQKTLRNDFLNFGPQANYRVTEELSLIPGYRFGLRDDITNKQNAKAQIVWLMITYTPRTVASEKRPTTPVGSKPATPSGPEKRGAPGRYLTF